MSTTYHSGSIMEITATEDGFRVTQVENSITDAIKIGEEAGPNAVVDVDYRRFPVAVKGKYITTTQLLIADIEVLGQKIGPKIPWTFFAGPLRIPLDLQIADGLITTFLKNDHQCFIQYKITLKSGGKPWEVEDLMFEF